LFAGLVTYFQIGGAISQHSSTAARQKFKLDPGFFGNRALHFSKCAAAFKSEDLPLQRQRNGRSGKMGLLPTMRSWLWRICGARSDPSEARCALCHKIVVACKLAHFPFSSYHEAQFVVNHGRGFTVPGCCRPNGNVRNDLSSRIIC
jgi:hypothetical protein